MAMILPSIRTSNTRSKLLIQKRSKPIREAVENGNHASHGKVPHASVAEASFCSPQPLRLLLLSLQANRQGRDGARDHPTVPNPEMTSPQATDAKELKGRRRNSFEVSTMDPPFDSAEPQSSNTALNPPTEKLRPYRDAAIFGDQRRRRKGTADHLSLSPAPERTFRSGREGTMQRSVRRMVGNDESVSSSRTKTTNQHRTWLRIDGNGTGLWLVVSL
jgi:hypothetical protein